jgi:carbamoyl-phosphate synthase large subunit
MRGRELRILINGVGGPTPASVAVSLKRFSKFSNYWILGVDANPLATGLYRTELFDMTAVVPLASADEYWTVIDDLVKSNAIDLALVQPEVEVVKWCQRQREVGLPCKALLPDYELASLLVDKSAMSDALMDTGLVPASIVLERDLGNIDEIENALPYPFWIRAASGSSGLGSLLVTDKDSLLGWFKINPGVESFLCSEYLPGRNLACKLLYFDGKPVRAACAERVNYIMSKVSPSGITGNTKFGRLLNESRLVDVSIEAMEILFEKAGARKHGFFTLDYKEDSEGNPRITEVNVRNVAFNGCFAQLGANFSEDMVRLLSEDASFNTAFKHYQFDDDYVFIRDVDVEPRILRESELLSRL